MRARLPEPALLDQEPSSDSFLDEVLLGLRRSPKTLPCKYFYDEQGSQLFDQICDLDEYYLTRTELAIMDAYAPQMATQIGPGVMLVEYGSGSSVKTRILLDHLPESRLSMTVIVGDAACDQPFDSIIPNLGDHDGT